MARRRSPAPAFVLAAAAASAVPAGAQEWSIDGFFSQSFEADTNRRLDTDSDGGLFGSVTRLDVDFGLTTQRTDWRLSTGVTAQGYLGPGDTDGLNRIDPRYDASVRHEGQRFVVGAQSSFRRRSTSFTEFDEEGGIDGDGALVDADAVRTTVASSGFWTFILDARNQVTVSAFGRIDRFSEEDDTLEPSSTFGGRVSWNHQLDPITSVSLQTGFQRFTADDAESTESINADVTFGINHLLTPRLTLGATAGVSATRRTEDEIVFLGIGPVVVPVVDGRETENTIGGIGSLNLAYRTDDTTFSFGASQSVQPSSEGELQNRTALNFGIRHRLAPRHSFGFQSAISRRTGTVGEDESDDAQILFQLTPTYSYSVTRNWDANVGYRFRLSDDDDGTAISNAVFFGFSRDLAIFP